MSVEIKFDGLEATLSGIENYKKQVIDDIKHAIEESAINIEGHAKQIVHRKSGNLARAITHKAMDEGFTQEIGTYDVEYAPHIEFGTSHSNAYPYLRPSLEEEIPNLVKSIENVFKK